MSVVHCFSNVNPVFKLLRSKCDTSPPIAFRVAQPSLKREIHKHGFQLEAATSGSSPSSEVELDIEAITKYGIALVTQLFLISGLFYGLDLALTSTGHSALPTPLTWFICYVFSLKSRVFNPLNNSRPNVQKDVSNGFNDRNQPTWTPPGKENEVAVTLMNLFFSNACLPLIGL